MEKKKSKFPGSGTHGVAREGNPKEDEARKEGSDTPDESKKPEEINIMTLFNLLQESIKLNSANHKSLEGKIDAVGKLEGQIVEVKDQVKEIKELVNDMEAKIDPDRLEKVEESAISAMVLAEKNKTSIIDMVNNEENNRNDIVELKKQIVKLNEKNAKMETEIEEMKKVNGTQRKNYEEVKATHVGQVEIVADPLGMTMSSQQES